jgi:glycosyltransferase involved in cell wall biosynthesis
MKEATPLVSVLMPVYNGMPYLPLAVESILSQSFRDFEFIIVDDCSNDDSLKYLRTITDERMVLVPLPENKGVTGALQEGMNRVRGKYVARLDADDVAKSHRLQTQVDYLANNPGVGLLGGSIELIDASGKFLKRVNLAKDDIEIRWRFLFKNPFFHSTVMFRYDLVKKHHLGYTRKHGEDYQLWVELMQFCKGAITSDELIQYRSHQQSWTFTKGSEQVDASIDIALQQMRKLINEKDQKLIELIRWTRGQLPGSEKNSELCSMYLKLMTGFIRQYVININAHFVLSALKLIRKRMGIWAYLRLDMVRIYYLYFQLRAR